MRLWLVTVIILIGLTSSVFADNKRIILPTVSSLPVHITETGEAKANLIVIIGGVGIKNEEGKSKNFLVTMKEKFIEKNLNLFLFPNWSSSEKAGYSLRASKKRARRILNLVKEINLRNNLPVYLIGFSRGSVDVASFSNFFSKTIDGIILASGIYTNTSKKAELFTMEKLIGSEVNNAVLVVHHEKDACEVTSFVYAKKFYKKLKAPRKTMFKYKSGGTSGRECGPKHYHGFENIGEQVAEDIAKWIVVDSLR